MKCEIPDCNQRVADIHHLIPRSKFGSKRKEEQDHISNLVGLCRRHHEMAHNIDPSLNDRIKEIVKNRK